MSDMSALAQAIQKGDRDEAGKRTTAAIAAGTGARQVLEALVAEMDDVGRRFKANKIFVPQVLIAARAMKQAMALLEPELIKADIQPRFTAVVGTVQGDLHDIGKNLVAMMWKDANFCVVDLGANVTADKFVTAAREHHAQVVGLSALLTTTMPAMKRTIEAIKQAGLTHVKIMIGGAPITQAFAAQIGADGFATDAASAVDVARQLVAAD